MRSMSDSELVLPFSPPTLMILKDEGSMVLTDWAGSVLFLGLPRCGALKAASSAFEACADVAASAAWAAFPSFSYICVKASMSSAFLSVLNPGTFSFLASSLSSSTPFALNSCILISIIFLRAG